MEFLPRSRIVLGIFLLLVLTIQTSQGIKTPPHSYLHPNAHPHPHQLHHYQQHLHDPANQQVLAVTSHHQQDSNYPQQHQIHQENNYPHQQPHQIPVHSSSPQLYIPQQNQIHQENNYPQQQPHHQIPVHSSSPELYISPEFSPPTETQHHYHNAPNNFANNPPTETTPQPTTTTTSTTMSPPSSSSSSPGSNRTPHHLPFFFEKKINKIANKFSRFFNHLFHGHANYNDNGGRAWYPSNNNNFYNQQQQQYYRPNYYPRYPPFNNQYQTARQRTDFDHYGSCKFRPCRSVGHAIDSFFIRDGFGKLLQKFHH
ncbi:uncharacterized transmembrane protein DDB_G0281039 [Folsomia candida]|uniref:Uncharacterized protein n=1 Tax=Folsomia candida TaxID=158441 RepID=A0A226EHX5_FOLCA|nr:uncharacterized transmembrane protein DDB_G0281039 [Folsomia candida]OXA56351.1 hypothetical protein Fcan01_09204 [Folsomia candida]